MSSPHNTAKCSSPLQEALPTTALKECHHMASGKLDLKPETWGTQRKYCKNQTPRDEGVPDPSSSGPASYGAGRGVGWQGSHNAGRKDAVPTPTLEWLKIKGRNTSCVCDCALQQKEEKVPWELKLKTCVWLRAAPCWDLQAASELCVLNIAFAILHPWRSQHVTSTYSIGRSNYEVYPTDSWRNVNNEL